jgi:hypothetical protein
MPTRRRFLAAAAGLAALRCTSPWAARAQSPVSVADTRSTLRDYLGLIPTSIANLQQDVPVVFGDLQLQASTLGIPLPVDVGDDEHYHAWQLAEAYVPIPEILRRTNAIYFGLERITGFELPQIYSGVEAGSPNDPVTLVRGDLDPEVIVPVLETNGYRRNERAGHTVFTIDPESTPEAVPAIESLPAQLLNATFLDDGALVYAPSLELIDAVLAPESTLIDLPAVAQAVDALDEPLIGAALVSPGGLLAAPQSDLTPAGDPAAIAAVWPAESPMPLAAIVGSTAGGPTETFEAGATPIPAPGGARSRSKIALVYRTFQEAVTAATQIGDRLAADRSLSNEQPWSDLFTTWSAEPGQQQPSVLVTIEWRDQPSKALTLLTQRDLGFITG